MENDLTKDHKNQIDSLKNIYKLFKNESINLNDAVYHSCKVDLSNMPPVPLYINIKIIKRDY